MAVSIGIDLGTSFVKGVLIREDGMKFYALSGFGKSYRISSEQLVESLLKQALRSDCDIGAIGVTGMGSDCFYRDANRYNQIKALTMAAHKQVNGMAVVIDMGGQAGRVCQINEDGGLEKFQASEYCTSGSGKLLENVSHVLNIPLAEFGTLAATADHEASFTTGCAVFAESEAISAIAHGEPASAIIAGCHQAVITKIINLMNGWDLRGSTVLATGGGALNTGLTRLLEERLGQQVIVPENPQYLTAVGAAYLAAEQ